MSDPEKFRCLSTLCNDNTGSIIAGVLDGYDPHHECVLIDLRDCILTVPQARALRDWLTKALPEDKP